MSRKIAVLTGVSVALIVIAGFSFCMNYMGEKYVVTHRWSFSMSEGRWDSEYGSYAVDTSPFTITKCEDGGWKVKIKVPGNPDNELIGLSIYREYTGEKIWGKYSSGPFELEKTFALFGEFYFIVVGWTSSTMVEISVEERKAAYV